VKLQLQKAEKIERMFINSNAAHTLVSCLVLGMGGISGCASEG